MQVKVHSVGNRRALSQRLEQRVLLSKVDTDVGLVEDDDARRVQLARVNRGACSDTKAQRDVAHAQDDDACMLRRVVCDATKMCLDDVVAVQERQLAIGLDPYLQRRESVSGR